MQRRIGLDSLRVISIIIIFLGCSVIDYIRNIFFKICSRILKKAKITCK